jgi:hypothetical protein
MFVASKIENECSKTGYDILISSELIQQLSIPIIYEMQQVGILKGQNSTALYTLIEKATII